MERERFEELVAEGVARLPERFRSLLRNVAIIVEDRPSPEQLRRTRVKQGLLLLGLYEGVPKASRFGHEPLFPDRITIFQQSIEAVARTSDEIREQVAKTVWHEIGHYFGLSEHAVRRAEVKRRHQKS